MQLAGTKIVLPFSHAYVRLSTLNHVPNYVVHHSTTVHKMLGVCRPNVLYCLYGERVVCSDDNSLLAIYCF